ncbi:hypothetical protein OGAPHI_006240 [Ogataea philodendri]|uniref:Mtf2-like C-terminal domain-containing protein n=1 Tax=Ogataea philodendri TaxID=1378263 RepID=A0A9P8T1D9_9ASCO|nr:uncharacterized protein OGAPHI_006240 [Ogataea philodendri]KAH3662059.1 hypothetical protein OGAPHI_006240 [Ogataea philodendri]
MHKARFLRYYSKLGQSVAEAAKPGVIDSVTNNESYKSFFEDFSKSVMSQNKLSSISEQKTFGKVFDYLMKKTKPVGVAETLKEFSNINDQQAKNPVGKKFVDPRPYSFNLEAYKTKLEYKKTLLESLQPTLTYIDENVQTNEEMIAFIKDTVIDRFAQNRSSKPGVPPDRNEFFVSIKAECEKSPQSPPINMKTLPVLLEYCLNSLTYDFSSFDDTLLILDYIREHKSIFVYEFGLNIDVYNSILVQVWKQSENLQLISRLVDEISKNAIQPDLLTYKILAEIYLRCMNVDDESVARYYLLWGNGTDLHRIKNFLNNIKSVM